MTLTDGTLVALAHVGLPILFAALMIYLLIHRLRTAAQKEKTSSATPPFIASDPERKSVSASGLYRYKLKEHVEREEGFRRRTSSVCSDATTPRETELNRFACSTTCEDQPETASFSPDLDIEDIDTPGLFCPSVYSNVRKPVDEAETLPKHCYTSREFYRQELKKVFGPSWTFMGRVGELPGPGTFLTLDTAWAGSLMVLRGHDGELRAFANVCRHRGAKLLSQPRGVVKRVGITCPYHSWLYSLEGQLKGAPGLNKALHFDRKDYGLIPVRLDTFCGFIFISTSNDTPPLADFVGNLPEQFAAWNMSDVRCVGRREYEVKCNWKFLVENTCETYHTATVHKATLGPMKSEVLKHCSSNWAGVQVETSRSVVPLAGDAAPFGQVDDKTTFNMLFPSVQINITWDCMWCMRVLPLAVDRSRVTMFFCFPQKTIERLHFDDEVLNYKMRWHLAVEEDNEISENQMKGVASRFTVPGRFAVDREPAVWQFDNWILDKVLG